MPTYTNTSTQARYLPNGYVSRNIFLRPGESAEIDEYLNPNIPDMVNFTMADHDPDTGPIFAFSESTAGLTGTETIDVPWVNNHIDVLLIVSEGTGELSFNGSTITIDLAAGTYRFDEMLSRYLNCIKLTGTALKYQLYCIKRR